MALMSINCPLSIAKSFVLTNEDSEQPHHQRQFVVQDHHHHHHHHHHHLESNTNTTTSITQHHHLQNECYCCLLDRMDPFDPCTCNGSTGTSNANTVACISNGGGRPSVGHHHPSSGQANTANMTLNDLKPQSQSSDGSGLGSSTSSSPGSDGFVRSEVRLMKNLLLLSFTSSLSLGIVHSLITIDRYIYGPWTYIGFAVCFMLSALSVYYAQAFVTRFGPNQTLTLSTASVVLFVLVHYSSNFILFQMGTILFALFVGPFYAAQLEFISTFIANLIHLTPTIKRYQEERYQRLLHLLLFSPSRIVGHLVYVILFIIYNRWTTTNTTTITSMTNHHHHQQEHHLNHSNRVIYNGESMDSSISSSLSSYSSSYVKPICQKYFRQQYCDHQALYYMFSSFYNNGFHKTLLWNVVQPLEPSFMIMLTTVFIMISMMILLIVMFLLHRLNYYQLQDPLERSYLSSSIRNVMFRTFHDNHLRLLLPMAFFVGLEQGFFMSDYNKLYVSCALGLQSVGMIMLTRGFIHLLTTLLVHEFIRHIQRPLVLLAGSFCQLSVLVILYLWRPNDDLPLYYVITMCWAISNAILETLLLTNVLKTFCADEWKYAFLTLYSMSYLGFGAAFAMSEFVCLYIKLNVLIIVLVVALVPMNVCELRLSKFEKILGPGSTSHI